MVAKVARHRDVVAKVMRVLGRENEWKKGTATARTLGALMAAVSLCKEVST